MSPRKPRPEEIFDPFGFGLIINPDAMFDYIQSEWAEEAEAKLTNINTRLTAALNKCPAHWVNGIAQQLGLSTKGKRKDKVAAIKSVLSDPQELRAVVEALPDASREALRYVLEKGGWVKYGQIKRRWGGEDEDSFFWADRPPTSTIGQLRVSGLLFVGKTNIGGRNYKVAIVPKDLRQPLMEILGV